MTAAFELQRVLTRSKLVFTTCSLANDAFEIIVWKPKAETKDLLQQFIRRKRKWKLICSRTNALTFSLKKLK